MQAIPTILAAIVALSISATRARAQSATPVSAEASRNEVLRPGAHELATAGFRDTTVYYRMIQIPAAGGATREIAQGRYETHPTSYNGASALLFVTRSNSTQKPGFVFLDSAVVLRDGLAPIWERLQYGDRRTRFDYRGAQVSVEVMEPDSARRKAVHVYDGPVFHFNQLDQLICALPLHTGYNRIVALYSEQDDAIEMDTVSVGGRNADGTWNVRFADRVIVGHYAIDSSTRAIVHHEVQRHTGGPKFDVVLEKR